MRQPLYLPFSVQEQFEFFAAYVENTVAEWEWKGLYSLYRAYFRTASGLSEFYIPVRNIELNLYIFIFNFQFARRDSSRVAEDVDPYNLDWVGRRIYSVVHVYKP